MSILRNLLNAVVPIREQRTGSGTLNALNAEVVLDVNGDRMATAFLNSSAFVGTIEFTGSVDGTNYFSIPGYQYSVGSAGVTLQAAGQPLLLEALTAAATSRVYMFRVGQLRKLRIRASAYTSGTATLTLNSDTEESINTAIDAKPTTLLVTNTGAAAAAVTVTLPAVAGLRHILDFIQVTRSATVALTAAAAPVLVTTTNLPGTPVMTFGADVAGVGVDKEVKLDFGASGLAASVLGTATTVVAPVYAGVIWRVTVGYRLGL